MNVIYYVGLDVHNDSIAISIAPSVSTEGAALGLDWAGRMSTCTGSSNNLSRCES
jgi:hypothetical protein